MKQLPFRRIFSGKNSNQSCYLMDSLSLLLAQLLKMGNGIHAGKSWKTPGPGPDVWRLGTWKIKLLQNCKTLKKKTELPKTFLTSWCSIFTSLSSIFKHFCGFSKAENLHLGSDITTTPIHLRPWYFVRDPKFSKPRDRPANPVVPVGVPVWHRVTPEKEKCLTHPQFWSAKDQRFFMSYTFGGPIWY